MPAAHLVKLQATPDLVVRVYRALLNGIVDGSIPPGSRLMQEEIASQLAVSRQPVLQALRMLKTDGLVLDAPGRGVLVTPLSSLGIAHVYQVRAALDVLATDLAAREHVVLAPELIERGRSAVRTQDVRALIDADADFHNAIYGASSNPLIAQSAHVHWHHIRRAMGVVLRKSALREAVWDDHEAIALAISRGDEKCAARLITEHDQRACAFITQQLESVRDIGCNRKRGDSDESEQRATQPV